MIFFAGFSIIPALADCAPEDMACYLCQMDTMYCNVGGNTGSNVGCTGYNDWDNTQCGGSYCSLHYTTDSMNCPTEHMNYQCMMNAGCNVGCSGYCSTNTGAGDQMNCPTEYMAAQCNMNPQYDPSCPGYNVGGNTGSNVGCTGYNDWDNTQCGGSYCSLHYTTDSMNCPTEHMNYQCSQNPLYDPSCSGYSACTENDWDPQLCGGETYCEVNRLTDSSCQTSACSLSDWNPIICRGETYCAVNSITDPEHCPVPTKGCSSPTDWSVIDCGANTYCDAHPAACGITGTCSPHDWEANCGADTYCEAHPSDTVNCPAPLAKGCSSPVDWNVVDCGANTYCEAHPAACGITGTCSPHDWEVNCGAPTYCEGHPSDTVNCPAPPAKGCSSPVDWNVVDCGANHYCDVYPSSSLCY